jgi:hypothetical protein
MQLKISLNLASFCLSLSLKNKLFLRRLSIFSRSTGDSLGTFKMCDFLVSSGKCLNLASLAGICDNDFSTDFFIILIT